MAGQDDPPLRHRWSESDRFVPRTVVRPLRRFLDSSTSGALVMLAAAVTALVWVNSPFGESYQRLWATPVRFAVGRWDGLSGLSLGEWVTDGAMTIFFLVVALEIKRELVAGELRDRRRAALPALAALGGMVVPAAIYLMLNAGGPGQPGWGIPMATDIAFAVAVVTAFGRRLPSGARLFLLTLAIVDDLGAIVVIAVFYTRGVAYGWLLAAVATVVVARLLVRWHVRALGPYLLLGMLCWYALFQAGVHPTLAGVAFGLATPVRSSHGPRRFPGRMTGSALYRVEHTLAPWSTYVVVPLFALASAGLRLDAAALTSWATDRVALGIVLGLLVGKTVGITGATWLAVRTRLGALPSGMDMGHVLGVAVVAGIGFTVALFITELAFVEDRWQDAAKLGIVVASILAAVLGSAVLRVVGHRGAGTGVAVAPPGGLAS